MFDAIGQIFGLIFSVNFILTVITASTPLLLAASGELVVERAGVLNLGIEGMMIMGAACGFAGAFVSDSTIVGALCGVVAGAAMSAIFAFLTRIASRAPDFFRIPQDRLSEVGFRIEV